MINPVGFRFRPSDEEIVDHYLRLKNLGTNTSHVDEAISTVNICSFDPWDLPSQSRMESRDRVWYFFGLKENKYNRGERQSRRTSSGFWKKTGVTMDIMRKSGNREKMGEKRVLVFHLSKTLGGSKSDWVMHEYDATSLSPNQMMTYTFCKVKFKGQETDFSSSSGGEIVEHSRSLIPPMNNIGGSEGSSIQRLTSQQLQNPGFLDLDALDSDFGDLWKYDSKILFGDDDDVGNEQSKIVFMDEDRSDYRPKKPLTGVFTGHSSDDSDSDSISATTSSIQTSSTCDSFGSSNHRIDLREDPNSTVKLVSLTQEVSKTLGASIDTSEKKKNPCDDAQGTEIGEYKMGHGMIKNKRAGFFYRIIQRFVKKIHLCSSISRT